MPDPVQTALPFGPARPNVIALPEDEREKLVTLVACLLLQAVRQHKTGRTEDEERNG